MAAPKNMTRGERVLRARAAAHSRWAKTPDRPAATRPARAGFLAKFEAQVDPEGKLRPDIRARLAENAIKAHFAKLALASARARRIRRGLAA